MRRLSGGSCSSHRQGEVSCWDVPGISAGEDDLKYNNISTKIYRPKASELYTITTVFHEVEVAVGRISCFTPRFSRSDKTMELCVTFYLLLFWYIHNSWHDDYCYCCNSRIMLCSIICVYDIILLILKCTYHMVVGRQYIDWYPDWNNAGVTWDVIESEVGMSSCYHTRGNLKISPHLASFSYSKKSLQAQWHRQ